MPAPSATTARPGGSPADLTAVWTVITSMYRAFTTGERDRIDAFLDPEATIFDSATPALVRGRPELDRVRDSRPPAGAPTELTAYDQVIDIFGDLAVARYWLRVDTAAHPPELVRNTAVLLRHPTTWLIAHLHEDPR
jgi:hypothetical protein